jgi:uroporphyrinogen decarboxylase
MIPTMTSRERVRKAINFEEADRVPFDLGGTKETGIHMDAYVELGRYLGLDVELPKVYDQFQMLARVGEPVRRRLHCDVVQVENLVETWGLANRNWKVFRTGRGNEVLMPGGLNPVKDERAFWSSATPRASRWPRWRREACISTARPLRGCQTPSS